MAARRRGHEPALYRKFAAIFNGLMSHAVGGDMAGASDFKLLDRQVVNTLLQFPERNRFFRGMVTWVGYRVADVEFDAGARDRQHQVVAGRADPPFLGNLLAFSSLPLVAVATWALPPWASARCCSSRRFTATSPAPRRSASPP
jgi:dolichol-phosphate mannosyltransferase